MTAVHVPFEFYAGDSWEFDVTCHGPNDAVLNLADATVEWKLDDVNGANVLTKTIGSGVTVAVPATGVCVVKVPASETAGLAAGFYFDQVRVVLPDSSVSTQAVGRIEVKRAGPQPAATVTDWSDPCAALGILRPAYYQLLAGGVVRIKIGDEEVQYTSAGAKELLAEIYRLERLCLLKQGKSSRAAISAGYRPRYG